MQFNRLLTADRVLHVAVQPTQFLCYLMGMSMPWNMPSEGLMTQLNHLDDYLTTGQTDSPDQLNIDAMVHTC